MKRSTAVTLPPDTSVAELHPDAPPPGTQIPSHYDRCFGCGGDHATGLHVRVTVGEGVTVHGEFTVTENHQGAPGLAHGGVLTAAIDEVLGSLTWLLRRPAVTGHLGTDFVRPVPVGSTLYVVARCHGVAGRKIYTSAEGRLDSPDGPVAVRADALFVAVDLTHFRDHGREEDVRAALQNPDIQATARTFEVNP